MNISDEFIKDQEYQYAFHSYGLSFLVTDFFARNYIPLKPLLLKVKSNDEWVMYLPTKSIQQTLAAGKELGGNKKKLEEYVAGFESYLKQVPTFIEKWKDENPTTENWQEFVGFASHIWQLYQKTEWFYTDDLYKDEQYREARKVIEDLKYRGRDAMNKLFFGGSPFEWVCSKLAKKLAVSVDEIERSSIAEISVALTGSKLAPKRQERLNGFGVLVQENEACGLSSDEAAHIHALLNPGERVEIKELHGTVVMKGKVRGKASVIPAFYAEFEKMVKFMEKMPKGNVLIATTTSPELMVAVSKASAIVTDEGGLGSHAAIVSRELGIPCVVGTRDATQVIHDGDEVEVDANVGVVRLLR